MDKSNCSKCSKEFEKDAEDKTTICQMCDGAMKSDILILQVFKWICYSFALAAFSMFIPILAAKETSPGYYRMPGSKGNPASISQKGITQWKIAIPFVATAFGVVGLYLGKKEDEKNAVYQNYQNEGNELSIM